jgi:hypothetical protein
MRDIQLIKSILEIPQRKKESWLKNNHKETYQFIKDNYINDDWKTSLYMYCHDINNIPSCKTCGNDTSLKNFKDGFRTYCSKGCISRDSEINEKKKETLKDTLGVDRFQTEEEKKQRKRDEYHRRKSHPDYKKRKELTKDRDRENQKRWVEENREKVREYQKEWYQKNKEHVLDRSSKYYQENKENMRERRNEYQKYKKKTDPLFHLSHNIRSLITKYFQIGGYSKKSKTTHILGCSFEEFKVYLENQFTEGMTWENMGEWHLDHIKPISLAETEEEIYELNHYTNFQPLWAIDNLRKGNTYDE